MESLSGQALKSGELRAFRSHLRCNARGRACPLQDILSVVRILDKRHPRTAGHLMRADKRRGAQRGLTLPAVRHQ